MKKHPMNFDERVQKWLLKRMMMKDPEFWHNEGVTHRYLAHSLYKAPPAPAPAPVGSPPSPTPTPAHAPTHTPITPTPVPTPTPTPNPWDSFTDDKTVGNLLYWRGGDQEIGTFINMDPLTGNVFIGMNDGVKSIPWDEIEKVPFPGRVDMSTNPNTMQYYDIDRKWHQGGKLTGKIIWNSADDDTDFEMKDSSGKVLDEHLYSFLFTDHSRPLDPNAGFLALQGADWKNDDSLFIPPVDADGKEIKTSKKYYAKDPKYPGQLQKEVPHWDEDAKQYKSGTIPTNALTRAPKPVHRVGDKVEGSDGRGYYTITYSNWDPTLRKYQVRANHGAAAVNESAYQTYEFTTEDVDPFIQDFIDDANIDIDDPSRMATYMDTNEDLSTSDAYDVITGSSGKFDWISQMVVASAHGHKPDITSIFPEDMMMRDKSGQLVPVTVDSIVKYGTTRHNTTLLIKTADEPDGVEMTYGDFTDPTKGGFVSAETQQHIGNLYLGTVVQHSVWGDNQNGRITAVDEAAGTVTVTSSDDDGNETTSVYDHYNIVNGQLQVIDISGFSTAGTKPEGYTLDDLHSLQWTDIVQDPYDNTRISKGIFNIMQLDDTMSIEEAVSIFLKSNPNQFHSIVSWAQNEGGLDGYRVQHTSEADGEYITLPDGHKSRIHFKPGSTTDNSGDWDAGARVSAMVNVGEMTWDATTKKWVAPAEDASSIVPTSSTEYLGNTMASGMTDKIEELINNYDIGDPSMGWQKYGITEMRELMSWVSYHKDNPVARFDTDSESTQGMWKGDMGSFEASLSTADDMIMDWETNRGTATTSSAEITVQ